MPNGSALRCSKTPRPLAYALAGDIYGAVGSKNIGDAWMANSMELMVVNKAVFAKNVDAIVAKNLMVFDTPRR